MSIFQGKLDEIEEISIDKFSGPDNIESTAFFLSHCHSDHMVGLDSVEFSDALLNRDNVYLYTSAISCCILKNDTKCQHLAGKIKALTTDRPHVLSIPSYNSAAPKEMCVTLIPAGHCPGSVMFFFEMAEGNVLYTGDFRVTVGSIKQFHQLHRSDGRLKEINSCYLDATFFDEMYGSFPTREESLMKICTLIREWLETDPSIEIVLDRSAKYGYEHVYVGIKDHLGMKIHVQSDIFLKYRNVSKIGSAITLNSSETRIHACGKNYRNCLPCGKNNVQVKTIRVSCFWYQMEHAVKGEIVQLCPNYTRICYACHCSSSELIYFIKYLLPRKIVVCAVPKGKTCDQVEKEMLCLLKSKNRKREGMLISNRYAISIASKIQAKRRTLSSERSKIQNPIPRLQLKEERNRDIGGMLDLELSPSLLPQCEMETVDPTSYASSSEERMTEIEVINLSSDDSTEIFLTD